MKIVVFGASGGTGVQIVQQALAAGHEVTAFVRTPARLTVQHPKLTAFQGDVLDADQVARAIQGQEAVISALGPSRPPVPGMMKTAAENIVSAMKRHGVRRLISTTGAGVRDPKDQPKLSDKVIKTLLGLLSAEVLRDSENNVNAIRLQGKDLDWTIVRFPMLTDGPRTGKYRVGYIGKNSGSRISRADGADFIVKELAEAKYVGEAPVISY
jgi:putative NADH-flavin reductase